MTSLDDDDEALIDTSGGTPRFSVVLCVPTHCQRKHTLNIEVEICYNLLDFVALFWGEGSFGGFRL